MTVTDAHQDLVTRLLTADAAATVGTSWDSEIAWTAAQMRQFSDDPNEYVQRVVDEVQQMFHDCFVDTTWPACPRHGNHPLWLENGSWRCERDRVAITRLGEIGNTDSHG